MINNKLHEMLPSSGNGGGVLVYVRIDTISSSFIFDDSIRRSSDDENSCSSATEMALIPGTIIGDVKQPNGIVPIVISRSSEISASPWMDSVQFLKPFIYKINDEFV